MIKVVYCNSVFCDIYDPVFPDTCGMIFEKFQEIIHFSACRRYNFNNPVWCAFTSFIIKFVWITNHRYIWFDISIIYFIKIYGEWCRLIREEIKPELMLCGHFHLTEVWQNGELPADLASRVQPLFSTDFYREKWLVAVDDSRIEIALDQGEVKAGEFAEPICELELELLSGDTRAVLKLANQLVSQTGLRQGSLSKAARGYHLAQGNPAREIKPTTILHVAAKADVEQGLEAAFELALAQWQYHEELWVRGNDAAKEQVLAAIGLVRHALMLFGGIVPRKASTHLRDLLTQCEATIASAVSAVTAVYSTETAMAKLALTEWLVSKAWQPFLDAKAQGKISDSFKRFADIHLSRHAAELKSVFCQPLGDRYHDQLPRLTRDIDSILLLAGYYDPVVAQAWLENWQGLRHAIATGQRIEIEHFRNEANNQEPFWLHSGKR